MSIDTKELLNRLKQAPDIRAFFDEYQNEFLSLRPLDYLTELLRQKDMSLAQVANQSGQGEYVYKVFRGERRPSRDVVLAIAFGMQLCVGETQLLLRISKLAVLDPRDKRDSVILYSLKERHTVAQANDLLYEMHEQTL